MLMEDAPCPVSPRQTGKLESMLQEMSNSVYEIERAESILQDLIVRIDGPAHQPEIKTSCEKVNEPTTLVHDTDRLLNRICSLNNKLHSVANTLHDLI